MGTASESAQKCLIQDAVVLGVVHWAVDDVYTGRLDAVLQQGRQALCALHAVTKGAVGFGVFDEVWVPVFQAL